jgi:hypothetical protein
VVDPEAAWRFLKRRIFEVEGIELIQRPSSTFKDMVDSLHEAEKLGACCWIVDPLRSRQTGMHRRIMLCQ